MNNLVRVAACLAVLAAAFCLVPRPALCSDPEAPADRPSQREKRLDEVREKLDFRVSLEKGFDSGTPLKDALAFLSDRYDLTIVVDEPAFKRVLDRTDVPQMPVRLEKRIGIRLGTVLAEIVDQVSGTTVIHEDHLRVVPNQGLKVPIEARFVKRPLDAALADLALISGQCVVFDASLSHEGQSLVTANFTRAPLDQAVLVLADMAELEVVALDGMLYVTSPEKAKALAARAKNLRPATKP